MFAAPPQYCAVLRLICGRFGHTRGTFLSWIESVRSIRFTCKNVTLLLSPCCHYYELLSYYSHFIILFSWRSFIFRALIYFSWRSGPSTWSLILRTQISSECRFNFATLSMVLRLYPGTLLPSHILVHYHSSVGMTLSIDHSSLITQPRFRKFMQKNKQPEAKEICRIALEICSALVSYAWW